VILHFIRNERKYARKFENHDVKLKRTYDEIKICITCNVILYRERNGYNGFKPFILQLYFLFQLVL
jgi:hypothetical protein